MNTKSAPLDLRGAWRALKSRVGDIEALTLVVSIAIVGGLLAFAALAEQVMDGDTVSFDHAVLEGLRDVGEPGQLIGPGWLETLASNFTALGGWAVSAFVVLAVAGFLVIRRAWLELALVIGSTLGGTLVSFGLKFAFDRPRPDIVPHLAHVSDPSFPSGHAMLSAVIYLTLGALVAEFLQNRALKAYVMGVAITVTFFVGLTRVILGVHYPTDVLAGWSIGLCWALGCWFFVRFLEYRLGPDEFELEGPREDAARMGEGADPEPTEEATAAA